HCPHLTVIRFVVVSQQMQETMQNEAPNVGFKTERAGLTRLIISGFRRDENIPQIARISLKRQHIRRFVETTIIAVETTHLLIGEEHNRKGTVLQPKRQSERLEKAAKLSVLDGVLPLFVNNQEAFSKWKLHLVRTAATPGARCSVRYRTH